MGTITGKFHQNPLKNVGGVAETRLTAEKLLKGHNSNKNHSSMTSIKYAHLQVMVTITGQFHQNPLKTVGGVAETRLCLRTDGMMDGRKDGQTHHYSPLWLTSGTKREVHLQYARNIGAKFQNNCLKTVGGVDYTNFRQTDRGKT